MQNKTTSGWESVTAGFSYLISQLSFPRSITLAQLQFHYVSFIAAAYQLHSSCLTRDKSF